MTVSKELERALFEATLGMGAQAREALLERLGDSDPALRDRLERLLAVQEQAAEFFESPRQASQFLGAGRTGKVKAANGNGSSHAKEISDGDPNTFIGRYRLLQRLGSGGCGVVYMAEQAEPVHRQVALKIIRLGMDTENVIARFEAERQALAMMDHPNIAQVFDAGTTETGRPFFVMELVRGLRITDYCNQNRLDLRKRLGLFVQVCHAIQHAHQKGIIHRDIKPSNILVTLHDGMPAPKVIDFGIAKATEEPLTDKTFCTPQGHLVGTPAYMSPEQAETGGLDVDTRSDIYSLGALLYELLTGRPPFDPKKLVQAGMDEMRRTLRDCEPERPSAVVAALHGEELQAATQQRQVEQAKLSASLRGDLDWIVMRALDKDRTRRYATANGLAMDIQRYLNNEAVTARPPSRFYRFQKLVRRNKGVFVGVAAVSVALILGFGTSTRLFFKERAERKRAELAEDQKGSLLRQAEQMRANEAKLRREAENREKVTLAVMRVKEGDYGAADDLLSEVTAPQSSLDCAEVLRTVGEWHALEGRWQEASVKLSSLAQINRICGWDTMSLDILRQGAALAETRNQKAYAAFRWNVINQFAPATNAVWCERALKISLLTPVDSALLETLQPIERRAEAAFGNVSTNDDSDAIFQAAWGSLSVALMEYRAGHYSRAEQWCRHAMAYPSENPSRTATLQVLLSMAEQKLGRNTEALTDLAKGRDAITRDLDGGLGLGDPDHGFWFDWIIGRVLLAEANSTVKEEPAGQIH